MPARKWDSDNAVWLLDPSGPATRKTLLLNSSAIGANQSSFHPELVEIGLFHLNEVQPWVGLNEKA